MSLGIYLAALRTGLVVGSTHMTLAALLVLIPVHVLYLKYFEEYKLELRLGESDVAYRRSVPFLLPRWSPREDWP